MQRCYKLILKRHISTQDGARLMFCLQTIRLAVESRDDRQLMIEAQAVPPSQNNELPTIMLVPHDHYLSGEQVAALKQAELEREYGGQVIDGAALNGDGKLIGRQALARPHAMSDLSPECRPKRTFANHPEFIDLRSQPGEKLRLLSCEFFR